MAQRKVNAKFVISLAVVLTASAGAAGGYFVWNKLKNSDPEVWRQKAEKALADGHRSEAIGYYRQAYTAAHNKRLQVAATYAEKVGEMLYDDSGSNTEAYSQAISAWNAALQEDPASKVALNRLVHEYYLLAKIGRYQWADLQKQANDTIRVDPNNAEAYRARGFAAFVTLSKSDKGGTLYKNAEADLRKSVELDPQNIESVEALTNFELDKADDLAKSSAIGAPEEGVKLVITAGARLKDFVAKNPTNAEARVSYAVFFARIKERKDIQDVLDALKMKPQPGISPMLDVLLQAVKDLPINDQIYSALGDAYLRENNVEETKAKWAKAVELNPSRVDQLLALARLYSQMRSTDEASAKANQQEAINQYIKVLKSTGSGKGIEAVNRAKNLIEAQQGLCWEYLDQAAALGLKSPEGKAALDNATAAIEQIQRQRPSDPTIKLFQGRMLLMTGKAAESTMVLVQADGIFSGGDPRDQNWLRTKLLLVDAYVQVGQMGDSIKYLDAIMAQNPNSFMNINYLLRRAELQARLQRYRDALLSAGKAYDMAVEYKKLTGDSNKANSDAIVRRALQMTLSAAEQFRDSVEVKSDEKQGLNDKIAQYKKELGVTTINLDDALDALTSGDSKGAVDRLRPVVQQEPDNVQARSVLATALLQMGTKVDPSHHDDLWAEAKGHVDWLLQKYPNDNRFLWQKTIVDNPKATTDEIVQKYIASQPDEFVRNMAWAQYYQQQGKLDEQLKYLKLAEALKPDENTPIDRIFQTLMLKKDWDQAQEYQHKAEIKNIDGVNGKFFQGQLEMERQKITSAITTLKNAVALRPNFSMGQTLLGKAYAMAEQIPESIDAYSKALEQSPNNIAAIKGLIRVYIYKHDPASMELANNLLKSGLGYAPGDRELMSMQDQIGDANEAIKRRETIRERNKDDFENLQGLSVAYQRLGNWDKAVEVYEPVYNKFQDNIAIADNFAKLLRASGKTDRASKIYQGFVNSDKPEVKFVAYLLLGDSARASSQFKEAEEDYREAIKYKPAANNTEGERKLADMLFETEKFAESEGLYEQLVKDTDGKDPKVLNRYTEALVRQSKFDKAEELLVKKILAANPNDQESLVLLGYLRMSQRNIPEANKVFSDVLALNPNNINAHYYRALLQFAGQQDLNQAVLDLLQVRKLDPSNSKSRELLARVYRQVNKWGESVQEYQGLLDAKPELTQIRLEYAQFLSSMVQAKLKFSPGNTSQFAEMVRSIKPEETLNTLLSESIKKFPDDMIWRVLQGNLAEMVGQDQIAMQIYEAVWAKKDHAPQAMIPMLSSYIKAKKYELVIRLTTEVIDNKKAPDLLSLWLKRGDAYAASGDQKNAIADFNYAMDRTTKNAMDYLVVANELGKALPPEVAMKVLADRLAADPKHMATRLALAQMQQSAGKFDLAADSVRPMLNDKDAEPIKPLVLRVLALAAYQAGKFQEAADDYRALTELTPDDIEALNNLAFILADELKKPADAMEYANRAVKILKIAPGEMVMLNNGNVYDTYGWVKYRNGDLAGATLALNQSIDSDPTATTYYHLAVVQKAQNKLDFARSSAEQAVKLATKTKDPILGKANDLLAELNK